ncbi:MAG: hypothetical protein ABIB71_02465 [Candidatus Woesearchaeota archaeon]
MEKDIKQVIEGKWRGLEILVTPVVNCLIEEKKEYRADEKQEKAEPPKYSTVQKEEKNPDKTDAGDKKDGKIIPTYWCV